ncbi:TPA: hypothetical protein GF684_10755 [Escherichia coli]|mgnify:CR=1 FL=1|nr:phage minor tail protein L [Escherichia coli]EMV85103.1 phage minor tail protein L [Escherichia coli 2865200]MWF41778.1 phage minor tail protein L [Escherichia coli]OWD00032.1 phage minor tail protein L [Escherichia coli]RCP96579.1 phage minor tail protein L [Escherichia coli]
MYCIKNMDVKITILQVEVANLRPNPWNTNSVGAQNFEKLKGSIEKLGFFKPILARELDGGIFEILGGEHRWRAAMEQGISTVPVISVGKINDLVAKQMSLVDNERYGEDDQVALQRLIEEIQSEIDYRLSDIAPYDDEMAATLAKASVIDLEALEALSRGDDEPVDEDKREKTERVGAEHQTMRFKVTFDASDRVIEQKTLETHEVVEFELSSVFDLMGVQLPYRQIIKNTCPWRYRGPECGYTGPYFDKNNQQTTMSGADCCTKRYDSCNARRNYFANGVIHFGGFIGATRYGQ